MDFQAFPQRNLFLLLAFLAPPLWGCNAGHLEAFPPPTRPGVNVHQADYRLHDAVAEYIQLRNLPVSPERIRKGVVITEWFPVDLLELDPTPLATCPGPSTSVEGPPRYRARYRFNVLSRGSLRIFRVDAHWQKEARSVNPEKEGWRDCESTGAWEKGAEDGILLRARLLSQRYRDLE